MKNQEFVVKCSCGNTFPKRWLKEGKAVVNHSKSYCVRCAKGEDYNDLLNKFSTVLHAIQSK